MANHDQEVLFPKKEKWVCLTFVGGSSHSDESKRRGSISRKILYFKQYVRVASGVETSSKSWMVIIRLNRSFCKIRIKAGTKKAALISSVAFGYKSELDQDYKSLMKNLGI